MTLSLGSVTLLLQGEIDGLQVMDQSSKEWIDVILPPHGSIITPNNDPLSLTGLPHPQRLRRKPRQHDDALVQRPLPQQSPPRHQ